MWFVRFLAICFLLVMMPLVPMIMALFPLVLFACSTWPSRPCSRPACRWMILLTLFGSFRIGEASNPGPHFEADVFTLGTFNPSGLRNKAHYFQTHMSDGDIWTVSETHFYGKDVSRFRAGLCASKSAHRYCIADRSSLKKCLISQSTWKGVAVLAKHPTRALPAGLPQHLQDSGRALLFTSLLGDVWLSGAVVYGEPNAHHYPAYQRNNEHLLHHVASHVCNLSSGPRFVSGDWNVSQNSLPAFDLLTHAGFRDIQDVALERWGQPIQSTCKGCTRRDFLYISPLNCKISLLVLRWCTMCGRTTLC